MPDAGQQFSRRGLGLVCLGLAIGNFGCTPTDARLPSTRQLPTAPPRPSASPSSSTVSPRRSAHIERPRPALPEASPWRPDPGEIQPEVKLRAVRTIEAIGSWTKGAGAWAAADRVAAIGEDRRLVRQAAPLLSFGDESVVSVIDAQYGGILPESASVLVVCRQWRRTGRSVSVGGTTVDVRLSAAGGGWHVTALHPAVPGRPDRRRSSLAAAVLANHRIDLPPASVADIRSGRVHESVLTALLHLTKRYRIGVSVVRSGHPLFVFGTSRLSDHPRGRAFDTWRIDGHAVVDTGTPRRLVTGYMRAAAEAGSYNVGGPYLLAGPGNQYFSDATHHDHVHAGFIG